MNKHLLKLALLAFMTISCKDHEKQKEKAGKISEPEEIFKSIQCFSYANNKDTIYLKLTNFKDSTVEGNLTYNLYEKDRNQGELKGKWSGDSLFADYRFKAEGTTSTREIFFLKTDSGLIEGYGPVKDTLNKVIFQDHHTLVVNQNINLKQVNCD